MKEPARGHFTRWKSLDPEKELSGTVVFNLAPGERGDHDGVRINQGEREKSIGEREPE
jgi:hypothetical protein